MHPDSYLFTSGISVAGCVVAALFFVKFWRRSREPLFVFFAIAFLLLAIPPTYSGITGLTRDQHGDIYLFRFAAFLVIIAGIVWTNVRGSGAVKKNGEG